MFLSYLVMGTSHKTEEYDDETDTFRDDGGCPTGGSADVGRIGTPGTIFAATGGMTLVRNDFQGQTIWACKMSIDAKTGPSIGDSPARAKTGIINAGTMANVGNCPQLTLDPTTFTINSANSSGGTGVMNGMTFRVNGYWFCNTTAAVPFTWVNNGAGGSNIQFSSAPISGTCLMSADLATCPNIDAKP